MSDESDPLPEMLHDLSVGLFKVRLLLAEATPAEWKAYAGRLNTLKDLVASFPTSPRSRHTLGFLAPIAGRKRRA